MSDGDSFKMDSSSFASRMRQPVNNRSVDGFVDHSSMNSRRVQPRPEHMPPVQPRPINDFRGQPQYSSPVPAQPRQIQHTSHQVGPSPRQQLHLQTNPRTQPKSPVAQPVKTTSVSNSITPVPYPANKPAQSAVIDRGQVNNPHSQFPSRNQHQPINQQARPTHQPVHQPHQQAHQPQHHTSHQAYDQGAPQLSHHVNQPANHRQHFEQAAQHNPNSHSTKSKQPSLAVKSGMVGLAVAVFAIGMGVSLNTLHQNKQAEQQLAQLTKEASQKSSSTGQKSTEAVLGSTTTQSNASNFTVLPDQPKSIVIPKLQLNTLVQPVVLDQKGLISSPTDLKNVGWYSSSAKPGEIPTAMVLSGVVGTATQPGALNQVDKLTIADTLQVIRGDGQTYNYKVVKTAVYDPNTQNPGNLLSPAKPGVPSLVLVTTSPPNSTSTGQGTVVYAEQI